jgi:hypothetical protein
VDLDEKNQILTSNIWLNLDWVDYSLVWNASEYGGVKVGMVDQYFLTFLSVFFLSSFSPFIQFSSTFYSWPSAFALLFSRTACCFYCTQMLNSCCASNVYRKLAVFQLLI